MARAEVFAALQASIRRIERTSAGSALAARGRSVPWPAMPGPVALRGSDDVQGARWSLGAPEVDCLTGGLDASGLHEIKPAVPGPEMPAALGRAAAFTFALRLAARRLASDARNKAGAGQRACVLFCVPERDRLELGRLYGPGLAAFGLEARQFLIVETARAADTLWAMEEGLRSEVPAIVIGCLEDLPLTPARRLSLAAGQHSTPCIALTGARTPSAGATATRWRIGPAPTGSNSFDAKSPGSPACVAALERCRHRVGAGDLEPFTLEWCDETFRFRLAAAMADREIAARQAGTGA